MTSKELRLTKERLGLTAEDICSEAGISLSTYHKVLRDEPINTNTERHLSEALNRLLLEAIHKEVE